MGSVALLLRSLGARPRRAHPDALGPRPGHKRIPWTEAARPRDSSVGLSMSDSACYASITMSRSGPASHELLLERFDDDSVARIYQGRVQIAMYDIAELARAIGMEVRLELTPSEQWVVYPSGPRLIERPIPKDIPKETHKKLDRILSAVRDTDFRKDARLKLMSMMDAQPSARRWWRFIAALARRELGRLDTGDETTLKNVPNEVSQAFAEALRTEPDRGAWLEKKASFVDEPNLRSIQKLFMFEYPEYAVSLTEEALDVALRAWSHRGGPRPDKSIPEKWVAAADLMNAIGLGPIEPSSPEQQWQRRPFKEPRGDG